MVKLLQRMLSVAIVAVAASVTLALPALAHVELLESDPEHGATVTASPEAIDLVFSTEAAPAGDGVVLVDEAKVPIAATVSQPEADRVTVTPDAPLENGVYGVVWSMRAGDAHPRSGSVTFRVDAAVVPGDTSTSAAVEEGPIEPLPDLELEDGSSTAIGDWIARIGRWLTMIGALMGIGSFAFAATSLIGTRREVEEAAFWVRRAGALLLVGTVMEVAGVGIAMVSSSSSGIGTVLADAVSGSFGIAVALRIIGGTAILQGTSLRTTQATAPLVDAANIPRLGATGRGGVTMTMQRPMAAAAHYRLDVRHDRLAIGGLILVSLSFMFDGHTAVAEPAVLVNLAGFVHVVAAGVWLGGVVLMAKTLWSRSRSGRPLEAAPMALRFSAVASIALVAAAVAGVALAWSILDAPSELISTVWGRLLLAKVFVVGIAAAMGAYNHFLVIPALDADPQNPDASESLRRTSRIEAVILVGVVALTAVLVGAPS